MRILFVSNIFPPHVRGGYELYCQRVAARCQKLGHEVIVATSAAIGKLEKTVRDPSLRVEEIFEPIYDYEPEILQHTRQHPAEQVRLEEAFGGVIESNAWALARLIERTAPDRVWIFNPLGLGPVGILEACLTSAAPCLIHLMDYLDPVVADHQTKQYLLPRYRRLKQSVHAIACSRSIAAANTTCGGFASLRIVYGGADFPSTERKQAQGEGPARFVYFGQVEREKGLLQAVKGFRALLDRQPPGAATFDIVGGGSNAFQQQLKVEIVRLGLSDSVRLLGFVPRHELMDRLPGYTAAVLLLSELEPFGLAAAEAAAVGLPLIVTQGLGAGECFPKGYPLFVRDRESAGDVADRMESCIGNPSEARETARNLHTQLREYFDFESVIFPEYMRVVENLTPSTKRHCAVALLASQRTARLYGYVAAPPNGGSPLGVIASLRDASTTRAKQALARVPAVESRLVRIVAWLR